MNESQDSLATHFTCSARRYALGKDCLNSFAHGPYRREERGRSSSLAVPRGCTRHCSRHRPAPETCHWAAPRQPVRQSRRCPRQPLPPPRHRDGKEHAQASVSSRSQLRYSCWSFMVRTTMVMSSNWGASREKALTSCRTLSSTWLPGDCLVLSSTSFNLSSPYWAFVGS